MTKKSNLLILSLLITIGLFTYLTIHHYALRLGVGGDSICAINNKVNCDVAATSSFAELFGIPIAIMGGVFNFIILCFVVSYRLNIIENSSYLHKNLRTMLSTTVVVSIITGTISVIALKVICPFCLATYVFSAINLLLGWNLVQDFNNDFKFSEYFGAYKAHVLAWAWVPLLSWAISGMIQSNYGLDLLKKQIPEKLAIWAASPQNNFDTNLGLSNKTENPRVTLVEFADFKCPHCRVAAQTIDIFLKGKSDVLFTYKPYPLDGNCNSGVSQKGDNSRCLLAAFALCAEKISQKGWDMHHWIFEKQESIFNVSDAKSLLPDIEKDLGLDKTKMSDCADSAEVFESINKSADEGKRANVEGTPTIYMNGKKLPLGQVLEVLQQAYQKK